MITAIIKIGERLSITDTIPQTEITTIINQLQSSFIIAIASFSGAYYYKMRNNKDEIASIILLFGIIYFMAILIFGFSLINLIPITIIAFFNFTIRFSQSKLDYKQAISKDFIYIQYQRFSVFDSNSILECYTWSENNLLVFEFIISSSNMVFWKFNDIKEVQLSSTIIQNCNSFNNPFILDKIIESNNYTYLTLKEKISN